MKLNFLRGNFLPKFISAVAAQALLSAGGLAVSLLLLRYVADAQYGYYVLVLNAIMLLTGIQSSFIAPAMVQRMTPLGAGERASLIGGLYREQRQVLPVLCALAMVACVSLWLLKLITASMAILFFVAALAALAALYREFFRMVLMAYRIPGAVLRGDIVYVAILICGAALSTLTPAPAVVAVSCLCGAALVTGTLLSRSLWKHEPWEITGTPGILRKIAAVGAWTNAGSVIHWSFSQGYNYLIVGALDVAAVAAAASTRLLTMPVNLLSTGVCSLMLPTASAWVVQHGSASTFRRLALSAFSVAGLALLYYAIVWIGRDFIFERVLHKQFVQRDALLLLWAGASILMVFRDQLLYLPMARGRYHQLTFLSLGCAVTSLTVSYIALRHIGVAGAPVGVIVGETINVAGLILMSMHEVNLDRRLTAAEHAPWPTS